MRLGMVRRAASAALGLLVCALSGGARGEVYRWTDEAGREHFAGELSQVPPAQRAAAQAAAAEPAPSRLQTFEAPPHAPARAARRGALHVPYEQHGNAMVVYARLNERVTAPFVVDTGAADVVVPAGVASQAGIVVEPGTPRETYATANGLVRQAVVTFESVEVGEARVESVRGSVSETLPVGLLGTSFFNRFTLQIDPEAHVLTLIPNPGTPGGADRARWSERFRSLRARQQRLDGYLADGTLTDETRQRALEARREALAAELEALEREADRAEVPAAWRE
jgi:clan AA aspartic protease (TIGR02281 family)